jgi:predicted dinucleotide-binding enzyme
MNTAIIGMGNIGSRLARNLVTGGEKVLIADKTLSKARKVAAELGSNATPTTVVDAIGKADIVILAVYFDEVKDLSASSETPSRGRASSIRRIRLRRTARAASRRRSRPISRPGQVLSALLPDGAELVKAFGTLRRVVLSRSR